MQTRLFPISRNLFKSSEYSDLFWPPASQYSHEKLWDGWKGRGKKKEKDWAEISIWKTCQVQKKLQAINTCTLSKMKEDEEKNRKLKGLKKRKEQRKFSTPARTHADAMAQIKVKKLLKNRPDWPNENADVIEFPTFSESKFLCGAWHRRSL